MTLSLEKTARSSVFNLAHDYSTALFNAVPEMILQGQDIPIHLGSLIPAMKVVAGYFGDDIHEGDLLIHNDPAWGGSHAIDTRFDKPVFWKGKLKYWTVRKGHLTDAGGPVPAGYNPNAKEIYAECPRIPPVKVWDRGRPRLWRFRDQGQGDDQGRHLPYREGTLCNAREPAPHMNCTTTPMETLTDAVRLAFEKAVPSRVSASWGRANGRNIAGRDKRHDEEYVKMVPAAIIPAVGAAGAASAMIDEKVGRLDLVKGGDARTICENVIEDKPARMTIAGGKADEADLEDRVLGMGHAEERQAGHGGKSR